jgi:hypothetical protein
MSCANGLYRSGVLLFLVAILGSVAAAAQPYIDLGAIQDALSEDMKWGYVNVEMTSGDGSASPGPYSSTIGILGGSIPHNRLILDTGANSALFVAEAAAELEARGIVDVGDYQEIGVAGLEMYDISAPYRYQYWGTANTQRYTLSPEGGTQVMYSSSGSVGGRLEESLYPVAGILGMPAMTGRVTTFDMRPWTQGAGLFDASYMDTSFSQTRPTSMAHRYSVELHASPHFDPNPIEPGGPTPVWANVPFATVRSQLGSVSATGNFLVDTGANSSVLSTSFAARLGLDSNNDGLFNSEDDTYVSEATVSGVGGSVTIPVFAIERMFLPTREGVELSWGGTDTPILVGVFDVAGIDGIFGMDMMANTEWGLGDLGDVLDFTMIGKPNFQQLHFDFTDWATTGEGTLWLDVSPELDVVVPEPTMLGLLAVVGVSLLLLRTLRRSPI